ncbi:MAG: hypothetical protein KDK40_03145, partial [Chlamydiia bacterium]|nr:hypothetical protein [Chlamydiia bacterium]
MMDSAPKVPAGHPLPYAQVIPESDECMKSRCRQLELENRENPLYTAIAEGLVREIIFNHVPMAHLLTQQRVSKGFKTCVQLYLKSIKKVHPADWGELSWLSSHKKHRSLPFSNCPCFTHFSNLSFIEQLKSLEILSFKTCGSDTCSQSLYLLERLTELSPQIVVVGKNW